MSDFTPSPAQTAVYDWVSSGEGSALVEAVAGSGKTHTLVTACERMMGEVVFTAFNKSIADTIAARTRHLPNVKSATFHSLGFAAWRRAHPRTTVDADIKTAHVLKANNVPARLASTVVKLCSYAKQSGVGVCWDGKDHSLWIELIDHYGALSDVGTCSDAQIDEIITTTRACLRTAVETGPDIIDFDDMLWLPLLRNAPIRQYDWVLIDESQDVSAVRLEFAARMMGDDSRLIAVGDRFQSIYGFSGAGIDSIPKIIDRFGCTVLPLHTTYRCSKAVTAMAQQYVPHIVAHDTNVDGRVWRADTGSIKWQPGRDAVLCRKTRPLVQLALELIRDGVPCRVEGQDIGKSMLSIVTKIGATSVADLRHRLELYRTHEITRILDKHKPTNDNRDYTLLSSADYLIETVNDSVDTVLAVADGCGTIDDVVSNINRMFGIGTVTTGNVVLLATAHRSKGREWDRVFILGFDAYMPSKMARRDWEVTQEYNLVYVAITRSKDELVLLPAMDGDQ